MQYCHLYLRKRVVIISAMSQTNVGAWIGSPPLFAVNEDDVSLIGKRCLEALDASQTGVPHPRASEFATISAPRYQLAGVRNESEFARGTKCASIERDEGQLSVIPYRRTSGAAFERIEDLSKTYQSVPADEELGRWILEAFSLCE